MTKELTKLMKLTITSSPLNMRKRDMNNFLERTDEETPFSKSNGAKQSKCRDGHSYPRLYFSISC